MLEGITVYYWIAVLCLYSTGGSCGDPFIYERLFWKESECWIWLGENAQKYARKDCREVKLEIPKRSKVQ